MGSNSCHLAWPESWCSGVTQSTNGMPCQLNVDSVCAVSASLKEVRMNVDSDVLSVQEVRMGAVAGEEEENHLGLA